MSILIKFTDTKFRIIDGMKYCLGQIEANDFKENLRIPIEYWTIQDYEKQWKEGLERIKHKDTSCLVTSALDNRKDPKKYKSIDLCVLYRVKNKIYLQNHFIIFKNLPRELKYKPFTSETCYEFIPKRVIEKTEDGFEVSEWEVDLE